jgi:tetratricopeptide (TPR) repeat protein
MHWAILENRPYLSLLLERAMLFETLIGEKESIPLYEEILKLNPNDNQGVRSMLATLYLRVGRPTKVIELASQYPDDSQAELAMGQILALLMLNDSKKAITIVKKNLPYLIHLIKELFLKSHKLPKNYRPGYITLGGKDEAYFYWMAQGELWYNLPHAMEFLKKFC